MRKPLRYTAAFVGAVILLLAAGLVSLLLWVAAQERPVPRAIPYIEDALIPPGATYSVEIDSAYTTWKGWSSPLMLRVKNVRFIDDGNTILRFADAEVSFSILRLLMGQIEPTGLFVNEAAIRLTRLADGTMILGFGENPAASTKLESILTGDYGGDSTGSGSTLKTIRLESASIELADVRGDYFTLREGDLLITREGAGFSGAITGTGFYEDGEPIDLALEIHRAIEDDTNVVELAATSLPLELLPRMLPTLSILEGVDFKADGLMRFVLDNEWGLVSSAADITTGPGTYTNTELYDRPLVIDSTKLRVATADGINKIMMEEGIFDLGRSLMTMKGALELTGARKFHLDAYLKNYGVSRLQNFWPKTAAPETRSWVLEHARWGRVAEATLVIDSSLDELQLPVVPDDAVQAKIAVDRFRITFLDNFPPITGMEGYFLIGGDSVRADFTTGRYGSATVVKHADFLIPSFSDPVEMQIGIDFTAPATDIAGFLSREPIAVADTLGLDPATASGTVDASLRFKTLFGDAAGQNEITGTAELKNFTQPGFLNLADLSGFDGTLKFSANQLQVDGSGAVNGQEFTIQSSSTFPQAYGRYTIDTALHTSVVEQEFGISLQPYINGLIPLHVVVDYQKERIGVDGNADLTEAVIAVPEIQYGKPSGQAALLEFDAAYMPETERIDIHRLQMHGTELDFAGSGQFTLQAPYVERVVIDHFRYGEQDVAGTYQYRNGMHIADLRADSIDLRPWLLDDTPDEAEEAKERSGEQTFRIPDLDVNLQLGQLFVRSDVPLTDILVDVHCVNQRCPDAHVTGVAGEPFEMHVNQVGDARLLTGHAGDAGKLLRYSGLYENMRGGEMNLVGRFTDTPSYTRLDGEFSISQHRIRRAPVLARLLNFASLPGIVDNLSGNGITFNRLHAPFIWNNFVVELKNAKTQGASLGLTANGFIDLNRMHLDMEGAVVPANFINSLASRIPILGKIFTGIEGEGIFVASYDAEGPINDPRIVVNPLSLLVPGFLRDLFDQVSEPEVPPALQEERAAAAEAMEAVNDRKTVRIIAGPSPEAQAIAEDLRKPQDTDGQAVNLPVKGMPEGYTPSVP